MHHMPHSSRTHGRGVRWAERRKVSIQAGVRGHGLVRFDVGVRDISITGFRFDTSFNMHVGTRIWLVIPGFQGLEAVIAWREGFTYGCSFATPLHQAVCDHLVRHYPAEEPC